MAERDVCNVNMQWGEGGGGCDPKYEMMLTKEELTAERKDAGN